MASSKIVEQYEAEIGYKPESLQKLMNFVKDKGISMKYGAVKKAFDKMKDEIRATPNRELIKGESTNLDVNKSTIDIDLMPTPEAEEAQQKQQDKNDETQAQNTENESKTWTFDVTKATEAINVFEKLHKNVKINAEALPQILQWANNDENKYGISISELKQAYSQKQAFESMDLPSNKSKKRKKKKTKRKQDKIQKDTASNVKLERVELKSMAGFCTDDALRDVLTLYDTQWKHEPNDAKQLLYFITEQELDKDDKYKAINFESINVFFNDYKDYKQQIEIQNIKIDNANNAKLKKKSMDDFNCKDILNKYEEKHGEPKDTTMFYQYVLELGYTMEFKELDDAYHAAKGVKKKQKKKVKINRTSKRLKSLYKKKSKK